MKFRIKIMLCMVSLMAVLFGIGGSTLITISFRESLEREQDAAESGYQLLIRTLQIMDDMEIWTDAADTSQSLENLMKNGSTLWSGCRLFTEKKVYYSQGDLDHVFRDAGERVDEQHYAVSQIRDGQERYMQLSGILKVGDEMLYLDVLHDVTAVYAMRMKQEHTFSRVFAVLLISCVAAACLLSGILTRPLTRLSRAAGEIASGNLSFRSEIRTPDEIGDLSREFDHMADRVEQSMEEIRDSMRRQEEFMGSFAHELKTPMTSVIGYADLIRSHMLTQEETTEAANYIFSEGKRLESLSLKLLALFMADRQEVTFQEISPADQIRDFAAHLSTVYAEFGIRVETDCGEGVCLLEPDLFQTLLSNLADNARKALDQGGRICLGCRMTQEGCDVWCEDDGRGIPEEIVPHLTEAFYREDKSRSRAQGGAGLGLTLCEKIAAIHNGTLKIESEKGKGTVVTVVLRGGRGCEEKEELS